MNLWDKVMSMLWKSQHTKETLVEEGDFGDITFIQKTAEGKTIQEWDLKGVHTITAKTESFDDENDIIEMKIKYEK